MNDRPTGTLVCAFCGEPADIAHFLSIDACPKFRRSRRGDGLAFWRGLGFALFFSALIALAVFA